jgi:hypothetical protein
MLRKSRAGAGVLGEIDQCTASWLQEALARRATCAPQAGVLAERISSYGGAPMAVAVMERVFTGRIDQENRQRQPIAA